MSPIRKKKQKTFIRFNKFKDNRLIMWIIIYKYLLLTYLNNNNNNKKTVIRKIGLSFYVLYFCRYVSFSLEFRLCFLKLYLADILTK